MQHLPVFRKLHTGLVWLRGSSLVTHIDGSSRLKYKIIPRRLEPSNSITRLEPRNETVVRQGASHAHPTKNNQPQGSKIMSGDLTNIPVASHEVISRFGKFEGEQFEIRLRDKEGVAAI